MARKEMREKEKERKMREKEKERKEMRENEKRKEVRIHEDLHAKHESTVGQGPMQWRTVL
jgi:hypothetical protein